MRLEVLNVITNIYDDKFIELQNDVFVKIEDEQFRKIFEGLPETSEQYLNYKEVAKHQKYYVVFPSKDEHGLGFNYLAADSYHHLFWIEDARYDGLSWDERSQFTEEEIESIDKRYMAFAISVSEIEKRFENERFE